MIGPRIGASVGARIGPNIGDGVAAGGGIPGVTRDINGLYFPANATEWTALMAAAGLATGNPTCCWNMQEASGNLVDTISGVNLTPSGAGHLYQQSFTGFGRKGVQTVDGTVGQKWINSTTAPNPATVSTLWLLWVGFAAGNPPAANRDVVANAATLDARVLATTGRFQIINGASTSGAVSAVATNFRLLIVKHDITNSTFVGYTDQEKIVGTFATNTSNPMIVIGGQTAAAGSFWYPYMAEFSGAAAELSDAQVKTLANTLIGNNVIPWS